MDIVLKFPLIKRMVYGVVAVGLMLLGLASRRYMARTLHQAKGMTEGSSFVHEYVGDAIWAAMIYVGFRFLKPSSRSENSAFVALIFCFSIEISQLCQAEWLNEWRQTTLGGLILGFGFRWSDLLMYAIGVRTAAFWDAFLLKKWSKY